MANGIARISGPLRAEKAICVAAPVSKAYYLQKKTKKTKSEMMHPLYEKADKLSHEVIAALIEVHRDKGPGLIESIYERCFLRELQIRNLIAINQRVVKIEYKGLVFEENLRCDVLIEDCLLVELKAVEKILPIHKAQLLSYMRLLDIPVGLLVNFHELKLVDELHRLILPKGNQ